MGVTQYIGARYVPIFADPAEWTSTRTYEPLTIVMHDGNSFTSKQFVPVGIDINNDAFWAETGNYNAQVEAYRQEVLRNDAKVDDYVEYFSEKAFAFNTVTDMKASDKLYNGAICHTNGFRSPGDSGTAWYVINDSGAANEMDIIACKNALYANLIVNDIIYPECLGAYGDGVNDDYQYINRAIELNKTVVLGCKKYLISNTLSFNRNANIKNRFINNGIIEYSGVNSAIEILNNEYTNYSLGTIYAKYGSCLKIANSNNRHTVYVNIDFNQFEANSENACVVFDIGSDGLAYINDVRLNFGKFQKGKYAIEYIYRNNCVYAGHRYTQCAFEGVTYAVKACPGVGFNYLDNCRLEESVSKFAFDNSEEYPDYDLIGAFLWSGSLFNIIYLLDVPKILVMPGDGFRTGGNYIVNMPAMIFNNILYTGNEGNFYDLYTTDDPCNYIKARKLSNTALNRYFRTNQIAADSTLNIPVTKDVFNMQTTALWRYKHVYNKIIYILRMSRNSTVNFVYNDNVIKTYTTTEAKNIKLEIGFSPYSGNFYFIEI